MTFSDFIPVIFFFVLFIVYAKYGKQIDQKFKERSPSEVMQFEHPDNGYIETIKHPFLYTLLFGTFYFALKRVWVHAMISGILAVITVGCSWIIYPFFSQKIITNNYLRNGWKNVQLDKTS